MLEAVSLDELGFQSLIVGESEAVATVGQETNLRKKNSFKSKNNLWNIMQKVQEY